MSGRTYKLAADEILSHRNHRLVPRRRDIFVPSSSLPAATLTAQALAASRVLRSLPSRLFEGVPGPDPDWAGVCLENHLATSDSHV